MPKTVWVQLILNSYSRIFGVVLFGIILWRFDAISTFSRFRQIDWFLTIGAVAQIVIVHTFKVSRWKFILDKLGINRSFKSCYCVYLTGIFLGIVTPGRIGDFVKVLYLKREGVSIKKALLASFVDKASDIFLVLILVSMFSAWFAEFFIVSASYIYILVAGVTVLTMVLVRSYGQDTVKEKIISAIGYVGGRNFARIFGEGLRQFLAGLRTFSISEILRLGLFTFLAWFVYTGSVFTFSLALGLKIPFISAIFFIIAAASVYVLIPISVAGIGTRDLTLILLFPMLGYMEKSAILFSAIILLVYILEALFGFICWCIKPIYLSQIKSMMQD